MPYSQSWLEDTTARRCILVKATVYDILATQDITIYMSTHGYITGDSSVVFLPIVVGSPKFNEAISADGGPSVSYGDIEIRNANGEYDTWLDNTKYIWTNRPIQIYYGDYTWACANISQVYTDFELIYDGLIADINSRSREVINLIIRDKMERLNSPVTENKLGTYGTWAGGQTNQDTIKPLIFGEVHNAEPLLMNPATLEYMFNDGNSEQLIEIRDNGIPVYTITTLPGGATVSNATGTFTLTYPLAGQITISAQGVKNSINLTNGSLISGTYSNNIANLIALITTQYGSSYNKLTASDLDLTNLSAFASANTQSVGIIVTDRETVISVCQAIAESIGAQLFFTRKGKLQLLRYGVPTSDTPVTITENDIILKTLAISDRSTAIAATKLGYCKNWTVQTNLLTSIPQQHKDLFAEEWLTKTVSDSTVKTLYKLNSDPVQKDTLLIKGTEANTEATRLNDYFKVVRTTFSFTGTAKLLSLKLGQQVTLQHSRFGLSAGKTGQVVSLSPNWLSGTIDIEVVV